MVWWPYMFAACMILIEMFIPAICIALSIMMEESWLPVQFSVFTDHEKHMTSQEVDN